MGEMIAVQVTACILLHLSTAAASNFKSLDRETHSEASSNCPDKWLDASFAEMGCLFFNNTASANWEDANVICHKYSNSSLVDIQSEMQMGFLQMQLDVVESIEGADHPWWTAGTDVGIEGRWSWATTLTAVGDFVWYGNEPNPSLSLNCLALQTGYEYLGYAAYCDGGRF